MSLDTRTEETGNTEERKKEKVNNKVSETVASVMREKYGDAIIKRHIKDGELMDRMGMPLTPTQEVFSEHKEHLKKKMRKD